MKLKNLIDVDVKMADIEITGITCDSRKVQNGSIFVCIKGFKSDGHDFAKTALEKGAAVIITERDLEVTNQIIVEDSHAAFADLSAAWFQNPAKDLKLIGVTGTNGKTSVTYMLKKILETAGYKVGLVGTIQNMICDEIVPTENTTPNAYDLNALFADMRDKGCEYVIMEVSSHALDQCRVYNLDFEVAMFTNLTQDHLDYHKTMENYLDAKSLLFTMCKNAVINIDDKYGKLIADELGCNLLTYAAQDRTATYSANGLNMRPDGIEYEMVSDYNIKRIKLRTGGKFSVYN